jgi:Na+-transporting methylmalonyl-CoA/oxaloacetate decarboxylase gamma subunit
MNAITSGLWITLIGMGLVFVSILALWGLMALIVRLTSKYPEETEEPEEIASPEPQPDETIAPELMAKVAAAAVAAALALDSNRPHQKATSQAEGSTWLSVMRAHQLDTRSSLIFRKQRGSTR